MSPAIVDGSPNGSAVKSARSRLRRLPKLVWALLIVALACRVVAFAATPGYYLAPDPWDWNRHGASIAAGHGYPGPNPGRAAEGPTAFRPPLYPMFLGAVYKVTGRGWQAARLAQALVGTLVVALIGLLGWRFWDRRVGVVAMAIAAVYPPMVFLEVSLMSEAILLPFVLGAVLAASQARGSEHPTRWAVAAGAFAGLATLTRANVVIVLLPLLLATWWQRPRFSWRSLWTPTVLAVTAVLIVAPWAVRNILVMDSFVPLGTQDGYAIGETYNRTALNDQEYPGVWTYFREVPELRQLERGSSRRELELAGALRSAGLRYIGDHPSAVAKVFFWNSLRLLHLDGLAYARDNARAIGYSNTWIADAGVFSFYAVATLALLGALTRSVRRAPPWLWLVPGLLWSIVLLVSLTRFRAPIDPFIILLAALGSISLAARLRQPVHS